MISSAVSITMSSTRDLALMLPSSMLIGVCGPPTRFSLPSLSASLAVMSTPTAVICVLMLSITLSSVASMLVLNSMSTPLMFTSVPVSTPLGSFRSAPVIVLSTST